MGVRCLQNDTLPFYSIRILYSAPFIDFPHKVSILIEAAYYHDIVKSDTKTELTTISCFWLNKVTVILMCQIHPLNG